MENIPNVPGRGLVTELSTKMRLKHLKSLNILTDKLEETNISLSDIKSNIESYIGSTEIPLGLVGPLLLNDNDNLEFVYTSIGTLEGALVASMNRGCKAISKSGGFIAKVNGQKMSRIPMFIFKTNDEAVVFVEFVKAKFEKIKAVAESYSNHARLIGIDISHNNKTVHLSFDYTTGDASGQNMSTICTWHAILFLIDSLNKEKNIIPLDYIVEGNGSSDKKISRYNIKSGRGINVDVQCFLQEEVINKVLRTSTEKIIRNYIPSKEFAKQRGMIGFNVNVANAIAGIFVATGQDLGSLHESCVGFLKLIPVKGGLIFSLNLPNLVIGTVGGGTNLPKQSQVLKMMKCYGTGKIERFAKLIAGFALGLEISTFAAIVSGEFAKAHEKLGRNKPVNWLVKSELTKDFLLKNLNGYFKNKKIANIEIGRDIIVENGILTEITSKINNKLIGFIPISIFYNLHQSKTISLNALIKSKPTDSEVIKGLHAMAASIDPELSDLIKESKNNLEYKNTHFKEIDIYKYLNKISYKYSPQFYGYYINQNREIYYFIQEFIDDSVLRIKNSENEPEKWQNKDILKVISVITYFHKSIDKSKFKKILNFSPWKSSRLYKKLLRIIIEERAIDEIKPQLQSLYKGIDSLKIEMENIQLSKTVVHNDFNPRNIMIKKDGTPIIYDWELAVIEFPHRDIIEFLSFVLKKGFKKDELIGFLKFHFNLYENEKWSEWIKAYVYTLKTYIISRVSFYEVSCILIKYDFSNRVLMNSLKMLKYLEDEK